MPINLPVVKKCCGCIADLRTAVTTIAVLAIVTSPAVTWVVVRHSYMLRISCYISTKASRPDIIDIHFNNILSFGFGASAGLGPSCLTPNKKDDNSTSHPSLRALVESEAPSSLNVIKYIGWTVFVADILLLVSSVHMLFKLYRNVDRHILRATKMFIYTAAIAILLSFIYGMLYVILCIIVSGGFPIFEFAFCFFDIFLWAYFIIVVNSYRCTMLSSVVSE